MCVWRSRSSLRGATKIGRKQHWQECVGASNSVVRHVQLSSWIIDAIIQTKWLLEIVGQNIGIVQQSSCVYGFSIEFSAVALWHLLQTPLMLTGVDDKLPATSLINWTHSTTYQNCMITAFRHKHISTLIFHSHYVRLLFQLSYRMPPSASSVSWWKGSLLIFPSIQIKGDKHHWRGNPILS